MGIFLDPTFLLVQRGQDWVRRYPSAHTYAAGALLNGVDETLVARWRPRMFFGGWGRSVVTVSDGQLQPVWAAHPPDPVASELSARAGAVAADVWEAMALGHLVVARRPPTIDLLVEAGVRVCLVGRGQYEESLRELARWLPSNAVDALDRRARFILRLDHLSLPAHVVAADAGIHSFR